MLTSISRQRINSEEYLQLYVNISIREKVQSADMSAYYKMKQKYVEFTF
jgi:hypothetical protein